MDIPIKSRGWGTTVLKTLGSSSKIRQMCDCQTESVKEDLEEETRGE